MTNLTKEQLDAAQKYATAAVQGMEVDGRFHPGTVVAGAARMAGTLLFRSMALKLPGIEPGTAVLSAEADALAPTLIEVAARLLGRMGIALDNEQAGKPIDPKHKPAREFLETQKVLEPKYDVVSRECGFAREQAAYSASAAVALLINHCISALDQNTAFNIACLGFIEGAKTAPDPIFLPND